MAPKRESLTGTVEKIITERRNRDGGTWVVAILRDSASGDAVKFTGTGTVSEGDDVTLHGNWVEHATFGSQFKATGISVSMPIDTVGLARWLQRNVFSVGPVAARRMIEAFGTELPERCRTEPERVAEECGVSAAAVAAVAEAWTRNGSRLAVMTWLMGPAGLSERLAVSAIKTFGETVPAVVRDDPFRLLGRAEGFGWSTVDALAARIGIAGTDRRRLRGAFAAAVRDYRDDVGSTCAPVARVASIAASLVDGATPEMIGAAADDAIAAGDVVRVSDDAVAVPEAVEFEAGVWHELTRAREPNPLGIADPDEARACAEKYRRVNAEFSFDDDQIGAVVNALRHRVSVVTGGAGCGKTAVTGAIVNAFSDLGRVVLLCAPTGKAARRITELIGITARTIHRLLGYRGATFTLGAHEHLESAVVVVDEASMLCSELSYRLLSAVGPNGAVVFVGDPHQLPPVGAGATLRDILDHDLAPATRLQTVHRQAGPLRVNCSAILTGPVPANVPKPDNKPYPPWVVDTNAGTVERVYAYLREMYTRYLPAWQFDPVRAAQFMVAQRKGPMGTKQLNLLLQHLHQTALGNPIPAPPAGAHKVEGESPLYVGDKVIQTKNDYTLDVMNGEVGIVSARNLTRRQLMAFFTPNADPVVEPTTHLIAPIVPGVEDARATLCPVCWTTTAVPAPGGWVEVSCPACNAEYVASDGSPRPAGARFPRAHTGRRRDDELPVADCVVNFFDRHVVFPLGTGGTLQLAYCLTVHRMQGSQTPCAVVVVPTAHAFMQTNSWLYTAVTRASEAAVIIGDAAGIQLAARNHKTNERETLLRLYATDPATRPAVGPVAGAVLLRHSQRNGFCGCGDTESGVPW